MLFATNRLSPKQMIQAFPFATRRIWSIVFLFLLNPLPFENSAANDPKGIIRFNEEESILGELIGIPNGQKLVWKSPDFTSTTEIKTESIWQLTNSPEQSLTSEYPSSTVRVDLDNGDTVYGVISSQSTAGLEVLTSSLGKIVLPNERWLAFESLGKPKASSKTISLHKTKMRSLANQFATVDRIPGWDRAPDGFVSRRHAATLRTDFSLQDRYRVDLRIAWTGKPSFDIALGIDPSEPSASTAVHLEVWDGTLVLARQQDGKADASMIKNLSNASNENTPPMFEISVFHDANTGITFATDMQGNELARIQLPPFRSRRCTGIQVVNHGDALRIESIRASDWVSEELETRTVNLKRISKERSSIPANSSDSVLQLSLLDGCRLTGNFEDTKEGKIVFKPDVLEWIVYVPVATIHRLSRHNYRNNGLRTEMTSRLESGYTNLSIELAKFQRTQEQELLAIQSSYLYSPAVLRASINGMIVRSSKAINAENEKSRQNALANRSTDKRSMEKISSELDYRVPNAIQLQSGETIRGEINTIDEAGIHFQSPFTDSTLLKPRELRSIFLHPRKYPLATDAEKMRRLMTLPRDQMEAIPTNLAITTNGDYLRGNIVRLTEQKLQFLLKDELLTIPRHNVSAIVWLTPDSSLNSTLNPTRNVDAEPENLNRTDARLDDTKSSIPSAMIDVEYSSEGSALEGFVRMIVDSYDAKLLRGKNDIIGDIELPVERISKIRFSNAVGSLDLQDNPWLLSMAEPPKIMDDDSKESIGNTSNSGESSPLVNLKAPFFQLKNLSGESIRIDRFLGKVVVLDFWASWCGPCIESLPNLSKLASDFGEDRCKWIGINLQESKEQAEKVLAKLSVDGLILLDSDGKVANQYQVQTIPMVIVVDPTGVIHSVFFNTDSSKLPDIQSAIESCVLGTVKSKE